MAQIFANNVAGTLAANIGPSDTLILLGSGQGSRFPALTGDDYFYATIVHQTTGDIEVVKCTGRSSDTLTVIRGRDGTSAIAFTTGSLIEMRLVAKALRDLDYSSARGAADGLAGLDSGGRVPTAQLPANVVYSTGGKIAASLIPDEYVVDGDLNAYVAKNSAATLTTLTVGAGTDPGLLYQTGSGSLGVRSGLSSAYKFFRFDADGNLYVLNGTLKVGSQDVWHAGNFNPGAKLNISGGTVSGPLTVEGAAQFNNNLVVLGDTYIRRGSNGAHGLLYFGSGGGDYILMDAVSWTFAGGKSVYGTDFVSTSDRNLKTEIEYKDAPAGVADRLQLANFKWKQTGNACRSPIAQDVQEYAPDFVFESNGTLYLDKAGLALELILDLARRVRQLESA